MSKKSTEVMVVEHIFEVRHHASGKFLDVRGLIADYIKAQGLFPHWNIDANVINFRDDKETIKSDGAFIGYSSAGYIVYNPDTKNYFKDKAGSFWKNLKSNQHYNIPDLLRFGARSKIFIPINDSFENIHKKIFDAFFKNNINTIIKGKIDDTQFVFDITDDIYKVKIKGGPVNKNEVEKYMSFQSEEFKKEGIYFDLDYTIIENIDEKNMKKYLEKSIEKTWIQVESILEEIGI